MTRAVIADLTPHPPRGAEPQRQVVRHAAAPRRTLNDKIDGVVITFVDMSDRREVEDTLRESERKLLAINIKAKQPAALRPSSRPLLPLHMWSGIGERCGGTSKTVGPAAPRKKAVEYKFLQG